MPTWRNDSANTYRASNISGEVVNVLPNESVQSLADYSDIMTKTGDEPYFDPSRMSQLHFTAPGTEELTLLNNIKTLTVYNRNVYSGEVTCSGEVALRFDSAGPVQGRVQNGQAWSLDKSDLKNMEPSSLFVQALGKTSVDVYMFLDW